MYKIIILSCCFLCSFSSLAQRNVHDSIIGTTLLGFHYTAVFPAGDLVKRYGFINSIGVTLNYKTKHNWVYGLEGNFIFSKKIKNDSLLNNLKDDQGNITNEDGTPGVVVLGMRGFIVNAHVGKIFPIFGPNPNCGLYVSFGIGYILHKINIESNYAVLPLIETKNKRGYDYLTTGLNIDQFIGYSHMGNRGIVSFYAGFYFNEGFTKDARSFHYDTGLPASKAIRLDVQLGLRGGWYIPIYRRQAKSYYFN